MNEEILCKLAGIVLPAEILKSFEVKDIVRRDELIEFYLDEVYYEEYRQAPNIESKGFMERTTITDFPIRDCKVLLHIRRRRWKNLLDGVSFCKPIDLVADGTYYSKEFAAFLKETYGGFPHDLPFT